MDSLPRESKDLAFLRLKFSLELSFLFSVLIDLVKSGKTSLFIYFLPGENKGLLSLWAHIFFSAPSDVSSRIKHSVG
eukprot:scaffold5042_cov81-Cylindrotheca_fusiformis.AAC.5